VKAVLTAVDTLLETLNVDENGGGLLSRESLRAASMLRLEVTRFRQHQADAEAVRQAELQAMLDRCRAQAASIRRMTEPPELNSHDE
jgi:hypothetical protein